MAYMSQELKQQLAPGIKSVLKKYNIKGSLRVSNHSTLVLTVKSGNLDFIKDYLETTRDSRKESYKLYRDQTLSINHYWYQDHFSGKVKSFLGEVIDAMMKGNFDKSDIMTDYFYVGWYIAINIGDWKKPYILTK